jgi:Ser/Thr protein kinase RdoA (MazF antagonist)
MTLIDRGRGSPLGGRSLNSAHRVSHAGHDFTVKIHWAAESDDRVARRLKAVDSLLRGQPWYPPLVDVGRRTVGSRSYLVVIRPYVHGTALGIPNEGADALISTLRELADLSPETPVDSELLGDYASDWLLVPEAAAEKVAVADDAFVGLIAPHLPDLFLAAQRTTTALSQMQHGDLHEYNLIRQPDGAISVIDWDEAGFSGRPADCGKAMWFAARQAPGDFMLDSNALDTFLRGIRSFSSCGSAVDLALLGAVWFLPLPGYVEGLRTQNLQRAAWYVDWAVRFWSRFEQNLRVITSVAEAL